MVATLCLDISWQCLARAAGNRATVTDRAERHQATCFYQTRREFIEIKTREYHDRFSCSAIIQVQWLPALTASQTERTDLHWASGRSLWFVYMTSGGLARCTQPCFCCVRGDSEGEMERKNCSWKQARRNLFQPVFKIKAGHSKKNSSIRLLQTKTHNYLVNNTTH